MNKLVVLDTNVLLTDPHVLLSFPDAEVIIPETVLGELDKLKTARVDADLRFRGREVSRLLFELAEGQSLVEGIKVPDGGIVRVIPFEYNSNNLPEGFSTKSSDDKILSTAYLCQQTLRPDQTLSLVTNDLNMLLKAQTLGITVSQFGNGSDVSFAKKYLVRPFQKYRAPMMILGVSLAVFFAILVISFTLGDFTGTGNITLSTDFKNLLTTEQKTAYDNLLALQQNAADENALQGLGDFFFQRAQIEDQNGNNVAAIADAKNGIQYYERYLGYNPTDHKSRSSMATLYFYSGDTDRAIQEVSSILTTSENQLDANFNLGVFYWQGRKDSDGAISQFEKVMKLTQNDSNNQGYYEQSKALIAQIKAITKASGTSTQTNSSTAK